MRDGTEIGKWVSYYENGQLKEEIQALEDGQEKLLNAWQENGEIMVKNGDGRYERKDEQGNLRQQGEYRKGSPVGIWKKYRSSGMLAEIGKYVDNQYYIWQAWDLAGNCVVENGKGDYEIYYEDGTLYRQGAVDHGLQQGVWKTFYPDGTKQVEAGMIDGVFNGIQKRYYETGQ